MGGQCCKPDDIFPENKRIFVTITKKSYDSFQKLPADEVNIITIELVKGQGDNKQLFSSLKQNKNENKKDEGRNRRIAHPIQQTNQQSGNLNLRQPAQFVRQLKQALQTFYSKYKSKHVCIQEPKMGFKTDKQQIFKQVIKAIITANNQIDFKKTSAPLKQITDEPTINQNERMTVYLYWQSIENSTQNKLIDQAKKE